TALFRGSRPLFIRSRNLSGERTVAQELKLSATYVRETLRADVIETCYLAGNRVDGGVRDALAEEFGAPVQPVGFRELLQAAPSDVHGIDAELAACAGVFTA
ncbi:MAG TPA: hypothetical protein VN181_06875, partial [Thermoanaerobaculia bacterium]|nr:hypothetical protein [Thermoanaerobaculia bacterium]